jgi:hypothetical protein
MNVRYIGIFGEVFAPGVRMQPIARGESVEVADDVASSLLEQPENWEQVVTKIGKSQTARVADTEPIDAAADAGEGV